MGQNDCRYLLLPPYSPFYNAIEQTWAWMKQLWRREIIKKKASNAPTPVGETVDWCINKLTDEVVVR